MALPATVKIPDYAAQIDEDIAVAPTSAPGLKPSVTPTPRANEPGFANDGDDQVGSVPPKRAPGYELPTITEQIHGAKVPPLAPHAPTAKPLLSAQKAVKDVRVGDIAAQQLAMSGINQARTAATGDAKLARELTPALQAAAAGSMPSAAQIASRAQLNQQSAAMAHAAAAVRGGAPAMFAAQRAAGLGLGSVQAPVIAAGGQARMGELQRAQAVLAQHLLSGRGAQITQAGTDARVAAAQADLTQGAALQNQANALRVGGANLTNNVQAGALDSGNQLRNAIESQRQGLADQESYDARNLGFAQIGLQQAQQDAHQVDIANAEHLDALGLSTAQKQLAARQQMGAYGLQQQQVASDRAFAAGVLGGVAAPLGALAINSAQSYATPSYGMTTPYSPTAPLSVAATTKADQLNAAGLGLGGY